MNYEEWKQQVDALFRKLVGPSWNDLCGDEEPLQKAFERGETPNDFVHEYVAKYDLTYASEW